MKSHGRCDSAIFLPKIFVTKNPRPLLKCQLYSDHSTTQFLCNKLALTWSLVTFSVAFTIPTPITAPLAYHAKLFLVSKSFFVFTYYWINIMLCFKLKLCLKESNSFLPNFVSSRGVNVIRFCLRSNNLEFFFLKFILSFFSYILAPTI